MEEIKKKRWKSLALFLAVPLAVGGLTSLLTRKSMDVYKIIKLPPESRRQFLYRNDKLMFNVLLVIR